MVLGEDLGGLMDFFIIITWLSTFRPRHSEGSNVLLLAAYLEALSKLKELIHDILQLPDLHP